MRKYKIYAVAMFIVILLTACGEKKVEDVREKDRFNIKEASNLVETYLKYVSQEKFDDASKLLNEKVKTDINELKTNDLKVKGYRIEEMSESGGQGNFKIRVLKNNTIKAESQALDYRVKVIKDGIDYKISEIKVANFKEVLREGRQLRLRKENEVETYLIIDFDGLPKYAYSKEDNANMKSQLIPKDNYGFITLNYTGDTIALSTIGNSGYLAILSFDDTLATQGGAGGMKGGGAQGQGEAGQGAEELKSKGIREKPIGKEVTSCDIIENANFQNIVFSKDEKLLAVQYIKGNIKCIRVYNAGNGELIKVKFEEEYPINKVDVIFNTFEKEKMLYSVVPKSEQDKNNEFVGEWELNTKDFKMKKVK